MDNNTAHNERELLARVATGDQEAFSILVDAYRNKVFSHALTYTKSYHEAEELVQDIFMKVWSRRRQLPEVSRLKTIS